MRRVDVAALAGARAGASVVLVERDRRLGGDCTFHGCVPRRPLLRWVGGGAIVGATIVGPRAGELIHECALAMQTRAFAGRLAQMIPAYPSMSLACSEPRRSSPRSADSSSKAARSRPKVNR